jgi:hypothetical protein
LLFIGFLVVLIFSIPTLHSISLIKATSLFRNVFQQINLLFSFKSILLLIILSVLFIAYFIFQANEKIYTFFYFISFFVRERKAAKVTQSTKKDVNKVAQSQTEVDSDGQIINSPATEGGQLQTQRIVAAAKSAKGKPHDGKSLTQKLAPTVRTKHSVALYFPPTVTQTYNVKYNETEMGIGATLGADVIAGFTGFDTNEMKKIGGKKTIARRRAKGRKKIST